MPVFCVKKYWCLIGFACMLFCTGIIAQTTATQLKIKEFAVWGGSAPSSSFNSKQGVFVGGRTTIVGNIGSNHTVDAKLDLDVTGNIVSGNEISLGARTTIRGNLTANNASTNFRGEVISSKVKSDFFGNIVANGMVKLKSNSGFFASKVTGSVKVPAPSNVNYEGPIPGGGIGNTFVLPVLPIMPVNTAFDDKLGTVDIVAPRTIIPGVYRNLNLRGRQTITFSGPGNYIFTSVKNSGPSNQIIFDFKNTTTGTINIFVIRQADWGDVTTRMVNGNFPDRVYTEVHSVGSKNNDAAFILSGPNSSWIGTVWAPFRDIDIKGLKNTITGALWSGTSVKMDFFTTITYSPLNIEPNFISPYYPPPPGGKVNTPNNKIGAELFSLATNSPIISIIPDNTTFRIQSNTVFIEVVSKIPNDVTLRNQLIAAGMTGIVDNGPHVYVISGFFPISLLPTLNNNSLIEYVRPLYPPLNNAGQTITQGDTAMRSDKVRDRFGVDGTGVKVGVLSDSYNSKQAAQTDVNEGDLPGTKTNGQTSNNPEPVQVLLDFPPGNDEGRAMLQIVHDVAPKARLAYRTGFITAGNFAKGITELADVNLAGGKCDVIVDDITYITEPFLRDGVVANTVNAVVSQGVNYFSSAGNFGERSYEGIFQGVTNTSVIPAPATVHRFGATNAEIFQTLKLKPGSYTIVLQWNDDFHSLGSANGVQTDLDLYLVGANGFTLFGFNRSNLFGDPYEVCPFIVTEETEAKVIVTNAGGTNTNVRFKYIIFRGDGVIDNYKNAAPSTIVGHPNAVGCIAVGAMLFGNIPQFTPVFPGVASFSSRGGTFTLGAGNTYAPRLKPDLVAPNGVNTTVTLSAQPAGFNDNDPYPNFFGTSASAPHAAAVGALLVQAKKKFDLQTTVSPDQIRSLLQNSAGKFPTLPATHNFTGGNGFVRADSAVQSVANARPIVKGWQPASAALIPNGTDPFPIKITGEYLSDNTAIYFNGEAISNTIVSANKTEATGIIPAFPLATDPAIQLFNPAKSASGLDGGLSEALRFFSNTKDVTVKAVNKSRKYTQANPPLTFDVFVDGVPINQTSVTLADLKLDGNNISLFTNATPTSSIGLYGIVPSRTTPLNNNNVVDAAITATYGFTFVSATLTVGKMNLKITPGSKQIKYGDYVGEITYNYELDSTLPGTTNLLDEVKTLHKTYIADNALGVIKGFNQQESFSVADLANMSAMASFQAVRNARKFSINNGQLRAIVNELSNEEFADQRFLVDVTAQSFINYKANPAESPMVAAVNESSQRGVLSVKSLANGAAKSSLTNGQLQPIVNGQLLAMVNGQLRALVNGQLRAIVNEVEVLAEDYVFENGQLRALVNGEWVIITNGQLRAIVNGTDITVDLSVTNGQLRAIVNGTVQMEVLPNGQLRAIVNGQLLALVNGQLQALVNGQLMPIVNGQLMALVNGQLRAIVNGQLMALVNGQLMALVNGQLMALVNGQLQLAEDLQLLNGQLRAIVNGQLRAIVNGQLKALVNGVVTDIPTEDVILTNGQLRAIVNGQLRALVNGQLRALVNGQLQPIVNELEKVGELQFLNGQLRAIVNGQLLPIVNGQLRAMVNGQLRAIVNADLTLVNGQLRAIVNGQLQALVNGQLRAIVNGQLQPLVNGDLQPVESVEQISNGQLRAIVNSQDIPIANGQLQAMVNGQLLALVNGQLMAIVNGQLTFAVVANGQLRALVNGQLQAIVNEGESIANGQLRAMVNGQLQPLVNAVLANGQLRALVNNQELIIANGQLRALVNGQLQPLVNNFSVIGNANNANTVAIVDEDDINLQGGSLGGMFAVNMITGLNVGTQKLIPGAFVNDNFEVTYGLGDVVITPRPLVISADSITKVAGTENPALTITASGLSYDDTIEDIVQPEITTEVGLITPAGNYPITLSGGSADNYDIILQNGNFEVTNQFVLLIKPRNQTSVYGDEFPLLTYDVFGLQDGDDLSILTEQPSIVSNAVIGSPAGVYDIIPLGGATLNGKYLITYQNGELCISKKTLTITAVDKVRILGEANPTLDLLYDGLSGTDTESSVCIASELPIPTYVTPPSIKIIDQLARVSTYTEVKLNDGTNVIFVNPGESVTLTGNRNTVYNNPPNSCPGCITQLYIGMRNDDCGTTFTDCFDISGSFLNQNATLNKTFNAPTAPGVYYITQNSSWEFGCYDRGTGLPDNDPNNAIAVVIVGTVPNNNIVASTTAVPTSSTSSYPINIQTCNSSNYNIVIVPGTLNVTVDNQAPTANCQPITVNVGSGGTVTVNATSVNNESTDNSSEPLSYQFIANAAGGNGGQRTVAVNSGTRDGRSITGITYTYNGQQNTLTPANAIRSTLDLSTLTANPTLGGDANRFWDVSATTMTESTALRVLGDFDLGTALQDCADPVGVNHRVNFDAPIVPGAGPEIFIVHGGLAFDIQILDVNGNVALTIPVSVISSGSNVTIGNNVVSNAFNAFYLRNKAPYAVEFNAGHFNSQNQVLALDINYNEVPLIGGIRFGGGACNYVYEIAGFQPAPSTASEIVFSSANIGVNQVTLQVTDASGNSSTCTSNITVEGDNVSGRSSQPATTKTKVKPTQVVILKESIYPNPASNTIRVQLGNEVTSAKDITLVDAVGRLQSNISIRQINNKFFELNISGLPKGVYIIRAKTIDGDKTFKFIKM